jgi:hypothetical protein
MATASGTFLDCRPVGVKKYTVPNGALGSAQSPIVTRHPCMILPVLDLPEPVSSRRVVAILSSIIALMAGAIVFLVAYIGS